MTTPVKRNTVTTKLEDEFNKPVESIMRCEDFKSNFARRLSNRYTPRTSVSDHKQTMELKLRPSDDDDTGKIFDNAQGIIEQSTQHGQNTEEEQNGEAVKPPDKPPLINTDIKRTQASAHNMEVDTLRWQLAQTEANRQMHIALLKQIVAFLNRVKDHIDIQNNEKSPHNDTKTSRLASFNMADLPRSRSVVHVNKNLEYTLTTPKRISTRKISKSISNVNGFKEYNGMRLDFRSQSKLLLEPEKETSRKISEEISRLIILANTVLSTNIPDLAYNDTESNLSKPSKSNAIVENVITSKHNSTLNLNEEIFFKDKNDVIVDGKEDVSQNLMNSTSSLENEYSNTKINKRKQILTTEERSDVVSANIKTLTGKKNDFNYFYIEDESGFSSMSSFQEIGIPIISIIPPSPCEEIELMEEIPDITDDVGKWKTDIIELEKQQMKVFWV